MILVSACLAGVECRYDGKASPIQYVSDLVKSGRAIPVCPEVLGRLPIPRERAEKRNHHVFTREGKDVTREFVAGAQLAANIAQLVSCKTAILKSKSPSCGCGVIYDGTFSGKLIDGDGIFCSMLKEAGVTVYTENEITTALKLV